MAFWLLGVAWALATPPSGGPDEPAHVFRAASAIRGEIVPAVSDVDRGALSLVHVPASVRAAMVRPGSESGTTDTPGQKPCYASKRDVTAACLQPPATTSTETVRVVSGAARYNPVYYLAVGWPSLIAPGEAGIVAMRVVSAALSAALLASAFCTVSTLRRGRAATVGLLTAATPVTLFLAGVVNPNGLEITAAIGLWAAGLRLALSDDADVTATGLTLVRRLAIAASLLVLCRSLSPLWLALAAVAVVLVATWPRIRRLAGSAYVWPWLGLVAFAGAAAVTWIVTQGGGDVPTIRPKDVTYVGALRATLGQLGNRMVQTVGFFGWNDTPAPVAAWATWAVVALVLVGLALRYAATRARVVLVVLLVVGLTCGFLIEATQYAKLGLFWQTRYSLPVIVGTPLLAGFLVALRAPETGRRPWVAPLAVAALVVVQALCFVHALTRNESGLGVSWNPFGGEWQPAAGAVTVVALAAVGLLGLAALAVRTGGERRTAS